MNLPEKSGGGGRGEEVKQKERDKRVKEKKKKGKNCQCPEITEKALLRAGAIQKNKGCND